MLFPHPAIRLLLTRPKPHTSWRKPHYQSAVTGIYIAERRARVTRGAEHNVTPQNAGADNSGIIQHSTASPAAHDRRTIRRFRSVGACPSQAHSKTAPKQLRSASCATVDVEDGSQHISVHQEGMMHRKERCAAFLCYRGPGSRPYQHSPQHQRAPRTFGRCSTSAHKKQRT